MKRTSFISRLFRFAWLQLDKPNLIWDRKLNLLLDRGNVTSVNWCSIVFEDKYEVWIENHPFASGGLINVLENGVANRDKGLGLDSEHYQCCKSTKIRLEDFYYKNILGKSNAVLEIENDTKSDGEKLP